MPEAKTKLIGELHVDHRRGIVEFYSPDRLGIFYLQVIGLPTPIPQSSPRLYVMIREAVTNWVPYTQTQ